jgi:hypothetical protein
MAEAEVVDVAETMSRSRSLSRLSRLSRLCEVALTVPVSDGRTQADGKLFVWTC